MTRQVATEPDQPRAGSSRSRPQDMTVSGRGLSASLGLPGSVRRSSDWQADARVTVVGLALAAPIVLAMMVESAAAILLASVIVLAASLLSPVTGLVTLAFMAPFPRPLEFPAPGLYVAMIGAIFLGTLLRLPIERPRLRWPSLEVSLIGAFLLYVAASFVAGPLDGPWSPRAGAIASLFAVFMTGVLTFIAARIVLRGRSPYPVLAAMLASAMLASAVALSQSSGAEGLFGALAVQGEVPNRVTGPFADPNYFGAYLAAATTLGVACAVIARSRRLKIAIIALSAVAGVALVLTLSRGALAALIAGLTTLAFTRGRKVGLAAVAAIAARRRRCLADVRRTALRLQPRYRRRRCDFAARGLGSHGSVARGPGGLPVIPSDRHRLGEVHRGGIKRDRCSQLVHRSPGRDWHHGLHPVDAIHRGVRVGVAHETSDCTDGRILRPRYLDGGGPIHRGSCGLRFGRPGADRPGGCDRVGLDATRAGGRSANDGRFSLGTRTGESELVLSAG